MEDVGPVEARVDERLDGLRALFAQRDEARVGREPFGGCLGLLRPRGERRGLRAAACDLVVGTAVEECHDRQTADQQQHGVGAALRAPGADRLAASLLGRESG